MWWRGEDRRILAYGEPVDMRKGVQGLLGITRNVLGEEVLSGNVFVFINRSRTLLKMVWWDRTGWCLLGKRLERARYELRTEEKKQELTRAELELLLDGVLMRVVRKGVPAREKCTINSA